MGFVPIMSSEIVIDNCGNQKRASRNVICMCGSINYLLCSQRLWHCTKNALNLYFIVVIHESLTKVYMFGVILFLEDFSVIMTTTHLNTALHFTTWNIFGGISIKT